MYPKINMSLLHKRNLKNIHITYKFKTTKLGDILLGFHHEKLCHLSFRDQNTFNLNAIKEDFPGCTLAEDPQVTENDFFSDTSQDVDVLLTGTEFQIKTWRALTEIDAGVTVSYEQVAQMIGNAKAVRAVANAIARNKIACLIPCHRVINKNGKIGKYRWGTEQKKTLLDHERDQ